jgi:hypothetical protein
MSRGQSLLCFDLIIAERLGWSFEASRLRIDILHSRSFAAGYYSHAIISHVRYSKRIHGLHVTAAVSHRIRFGRQSQFGSLNSFLIPTTSVTPSHHNTTTTSTLSHDPPFFSSKAHPRRPRKNRQDTPRHYQSLHQPSSQNSTCNLAQPPQ